MKSNHSFNGSWPPAPERDTLRASSLENPKLTLMGRPRRDKFFGWVLAGVPLILVEFALPTLLYTTGIKTQFERHLREPLYFASFFVLTLGCVIAQVFFYYMVRSRLPFLARGFRLGLWIWSPMLLVLALALPALTHSK